MEHDGQRWRLNVPRWAGERYDTDKTTNIWIPPATETEPSGFLFTSIRGIYTLICGASFTALLLQRFSASSEMSSSLCSSETRTASVFCIRPDDQILKFKIYLVHFWCVCIFHLFSSVNIREMKSTDAPVVFQVSDCDRLCAESFKKVCVCIWITWFASHNIYH